MPGGASCLWGPLPTANCRLPDWDGWRRRRAGFGHAPGQRRRRLEDCAAGVGAEETGARRVRGHRVSGHLVAVADLSPVAAYSTRDHRAAHGDSVPALDRRVVTQVRAEVGELREVLQIR